jgi:hypothetical protein
MRNRLILVADTSDTFLDSLKEELATTDYKWLHAVSVRRTPLPYGTARGA